MVGFAYFVLISLLFAADSHQLVGQENFGFDKSKVFDEITSTVADNFYDPEFDSSKWESLASEYRLKAIEAESVDGFDLVVNELLSQLNTSHTYYFSKQNPRRYQLAGIFSVLHKDRDDSFFAYEGIGIYTRNIGEKVFVTGVLDGMPAFEAGIRFGDELRSVEGKPFHPIESFRGHSASKISIVVNRSGADVAITSEVVTLDGRTMFEEALKNSSRIIEREGTRIGYLHVWCYAGLKYHDIVRSEVLYGKLADCDAVILDLRDGWGGASLNYLNLFREPLAIVSGTGRNGEQSFSDVWGKPVALLTNGGSTSGKELYAYGFKKLGLGKVFGETTAGAVVSGRGFVLSNEALLYLAVMDVKVDGVRLEGIGVEPDVVVKRDVTDRDTSDSQLETAISYLLKSNSEKDPQFSNN